MIIVCDHDAWVIETEMAAIPLNPAAGFLFATAKIPAQRDGISQNVKTSHAFRGINVSDESYSPLLSCTTRSTTPPG